MSCINKIKGFISSLCWLGAFACLVSSCGEMEFSTSQVKIGFVLSAENAEDSVVQAVATFENVSSGIVSIFDLDGERAEVQTLENGLYNITIKGLAYQKINGVVVPYDIRARKENVIVNGGSVDLSDITVVPVRGGDGFVFAEVMLCSQLPEGAKTYRGDTYFRIYNNSSDTLYADGLCLLESKWNTVNKQDYKPNVMAQAMAVGVVFQIPLGDGRSFPVAPGQSILIVDVAKDHTQNNPNSFDLSVADYEWYDDSDYDLDVDVPEVPNLIKVYSYSKSIWQPNIQGNTAFALGYIGGSAGALSNVDYIKDFAYAYTYFFVHGDTQTEMSNNAYLFPNAWICDAMVFGPSGTYAWNVIDQSLDAGHVSIGETGSDANRRGRAARRKFDAGTGRLVDTNNSSNDFEVVASNPFYVFN